MTAAVQHIVRLRKLDEDERRVLFPEALRGEALRFWMEREVADLKASFYANNVQLGDVIALRPDFPMPRVRFVEIVRTAIYHLGYARQTRFYWQVDGSVVLALKRRRKGRVIE